LRRITRRRTCEDNPQTNLRRITRRRTCEDIGKPTDELVLHLPIGTSRGKPNSRRTCDGLHKIGFQRTTNCPRITASIGRRTVQRNRHNKHRTTNCPKTKSIVHRHTTILHEPYIRNIIFIFENLRKSITFDYQREAPAYIDHEYPTDTTSTIAATTTDSKGENTRICWE